MFIERLAGGSLARPTTTSWLSNGRPKSGRTGSRPSTSTTLTTRPGTCSRGTLGFRLGDDEIEAPAGSAVLARRETPHTYWNAGDFPARYLLVLTPNIARLLEEIHEPAADIRAIFARYNSEILT
jgi:hypothetical protein